jgi:serine/threonine protein phosphatase PrpC
MDDAMRTPEGKKEIVQLSGKNVTRAGCTASVVLITPAEIYCANAGDSRTVLSWKQNAHLDLSVDHKPENPEECKRIESADCFVEEGRINGSLAVSRGIGDFSYKDL